VRFLQWCLPRLGLRWPGFRRVRRTVCKRLGRRLEELGLERLEEYRAYLDRAPAEWARLDALCRIPVSRFARDHALFGWLAEVGCPDLARSAEAEGRSAVRAWSAGCASGEEPYTLAILWRVAVRAAVPGVDLELLATDADPTMIARAQEGCYQESSLRELPTSWREAGLAPREDGRLCVCPEIRDAVTLRRADLRAEMPAGPFDLILCRNVAFTYFGPWLQRRMTDRLRERLVDGGLLVVGAHEAPPGAEEAGLAPAAGGLPVYRALA